MLSTGSFLYRANTALHNHGIKSITFPLSETIECKQTANFCQNYVFTLQWQSLTFHETVVWEQEVYVVVDGMHEEHPDLIRDLYWNKPEFELPYTEAAQQFKKDAFMGSAAGVEYVMCILPPPFANLCHISLPSGLMFSGFHKDWHDIYIYIYKYISHIYPIHGRYYRIFLIF